MDLVSIRELFKNSKEYIGKEVEIGGWLRSKRDSKTFEGEFDFKTSNIIIRIGGELWAKLILAY